MRAPKNEQASDPELRRAARRCFDAALESVNPRHLIEAALHRDGETLVLKTSTEAVTHRGPVLLVAAGKPALAMAQGAAIARPYGGVIRVPHGITGTAPERLVLLTAAHPVPDASGQEATARLLSAVAACPTDALVLVLLGGGASSLLVAPAGDLTLADTQRVTAA